MSFRRKGSGSSNAYESKLIRGRSGSACSGSSSKDEEPFKLVLVGDSGVGKSCLLDKLLNLTSNNAFISTIGVDIKTHVVQVDGRSIKLQVWDTGGQERYRPVLTTCYRNAHGIIIVFDVTNEKSFANLTQWMVEVDEFAKPDLPKILVGNKADLDERRMVNEVTAREFALEKGMTYIETSAIKTSNIKEAFLALVKHRSKHVSMS